ncbi:MAG TPA: extracellular solute-binding protein [bacterium]|nr:extracellular solute-binding protein [bacterium]
MTRHQMVIRWLAIALATTLAATTALYAAEQQQLVVYHWWTAGGERQAMQVIFDGFTKKNPTTKIVDNPVAGGGGITLKTVLLGLLAAKIPPDTFQSLSGAELKQYVDGNYVAPVDDVWTAQNLNANYPAVIGKMTTFSGKHYGIPMNTHRANWLFYNTKLFKDLKLAPPTTADELIAAAKRIKAEKPRVAPIAIGTREKWPAVFLFDVVLLSTGGPDVYEKFYTGQLDVKTSPELRTALEKYKDLIPYLYEFHGAKTWSDIAGPMAEGKMGMMVIGDFAAGLLVQAGFKEGVDWDAVGFPQKPQEVFLMIVDTFVRPAGAKHPAATTAWLTNLTDPQVQGAFNIVKGSIAIHKAVPDSTYPDKLHRTASATFKSKRIVPSSIHGVLAPPAFLSDWQDILTRFLYSPDVNRALTEISDAMTLDKVTESGNWYWAK